MVVSRSLGFKVAILTVCMTFLFVVSVWAIDISVSSRISGHSLEGLFITDMEPRVVYHFALVILYLVWLVICAVLHWVIFFA